MDDGHLDRAVAPNLFDAVLDPSLVFALVLANLMSPRLWTLREGLPHAQDPSRPLAGEDVEGIQRWMDQHFEHVMPTRIAEMNGALDLDDEAGRLGSAAVEYALSRIRASLDARLRRGTLAKDAFPFELLAERKFPHYTYSTIDEAWACRRLLRGRKHKPLGLTCCVDEAAIFSALSLIAPAGAIDDLALIAEPAHYSVLAWSGQGAWWFYSKHELFSHFAWSRLVADGYAGDGQRAFDDRLPYYDRIITGSGAYTFATGKTSIEESRLDALVARIDAFFGCPLAQIARAAAPSPEPAGADDLTAIVARVAAASDANAVQALVREAALDDGHPTALRALYSFRTLDLPDLRPYLIAARRSGRAGASAARGATIATIEDALRFVASIPGDESIFADADRIAMPDETVRLATGTERDKALLLHVLLERIIAKDDPARAGLETLLTDTGSYVRGPGFCISTRHMALVPGVEGTIRNRLADRAATPGRSLSTSLTRRGDVGG